MMNLVYNVDIFKFSVILVFMLEKRMNFPKKVIYDV